MQKPIIKMRVVDWWTPDTAENFYSNHFVIFLQEQYEVVYSDTPDFILYGPFGNRHLEYDCVRIFYTGENIRPDYNIADYAISFDYAVFEDRSLRVPFFPFYCDQDVRPSFVCKELSPAFLNRSYLLNQKTKFCGFVASNHRSTKMRDSFFNFLSKYKKVDSGGRWKNNIGAPVENKTEWLQSYKFNLCFENSSYPGYLTEKLFDAFAAGCVPIYWGDTSLRCRLDIAPNQDHIVTREHDRFSIKKSGTTSNNHALTDHAFDNEIPNIPPYLFDYEINPKAFINAHNFPTFQDLLDEIKRIDNDESAFRAMLEEPVFLHGFEPNKFYREKLSRFFDYIFSQGPIHAKRRGEGMWLHAHRKRMARNDDTKKSKIAVFSKSMLNVVRRKLGIKY